MDEAAVTISPQRRSGRLLLHAVADGVTKLGPGNAAGIWTQGCSIGRRAACNGCMSQVTWSDRAGVLAAIEVVAQWLDSLGTSFLTISGGEPFDQARELARLIDLIRQQRDWVVTSYSGYTREWLERQLLPDSRTLLNRLDLLIDGRYRPELHEPLLWRGSSNQRIHNLSGRVVVPGDDTAGLEVRLEGRSLVVIGVPNEPGWMERFEAALPDGLLGVSDGRPEKSTFPFPVVEVS